MADQVKSGQEAELRYSEKKTQGLLGMLVTVELEHPLYAMIDLSES